MSATANRPLNWNLLQVYAQNREIVDHQLRGGDVAAEPAALQQQVEQGEDLGDEEENEGRQRKHASLRTGGQPEHRPDAALCRLTLAEESVLDGHIAERRLVRGRILHDEAAQLLQHAVVDHFQGSACALAGAQILQHKFRFAFPIVVVGRILLVGRHNRIGNEFVFEDVLSDPPDE